MTKTIVGANPVVADFKAVLPPSAHSLYYRDGIGNISTSHTRHSLTKVEVDLRPRYPLLGGWKVHAHGALVLRLWQPAACCCLRSACLVSAGEVGHRQGCKAG